MILARITARSAARTALVAIALVAIGALGCKTDAERRVAHVAAAEELSKAGDYKEALVELRSALKLDPKSSGTNFAIAEIFERQDRLEDAIFFYGEARRLDIDNSEAAVREAGLLLFDDPERSVEILDEVLERDPSYARAHMVRSRRSVVQQDLENALRHALTSVELGPDDAATHIQLGKVHEARIRARQLAEEDIDEEMFQAALDAFDRALAIPDGELVHVAHAERAKVLSIWPGHTDEALKAHRDAVKSSIEYGHDAGVRKALQGSQNAGIRGQNTEHIRWTLEQRVAWRPDNIAGWARLAKLSQAFGGKGDETYARLLSQRPTDPQAHVAYLVFLSDEGRTDDAEAAAEAAVASGVDPPVILGNLFGVLRLAKREDQAAAVFERLGREHADSSWTRFVRAQVAMDEERHEDAAAELRVLVGLDERADAYHLLAEMERRLGNDRAALTAIQRAVDLSREGDFPREAVTLRGVIEARLGLCTEALRSFSALAKNGVQLHLPIRLLQARCLYDIGRPELGKRVLTNLLRAKGAPLAVIAPIYADFESDKDPERARELLERVIASNPNHAPSLLRLARLDLREKNTTRALNRLNVAVESGSVSAAVIMERARVLAARGDVEGALQDALRAFEQNPELPGLSAMLMQLYGAQGRMDDAIVSFEEANSVGALRPQSQVLLSKLHMRAGNDERARELMEKLVVENPGYSGVKNDLAYLLARESTDLDRALELAQDAQRGMPRAATVADTLGFVYLQRGLGEPALEQFRYALDLAKQGKGDAPIYHFHIGQALQLLERPDEAVAAYEQALTLDEDYEDAATALRDLKGEDSSAASS